MKITIIRHAEPDYENNTLTPKGFAEADMLGKFLAGEKIDKIYCSPYNRAKFTADAILKYNKTKTYEIVDCLKEFDVPVMLPYLEKPHGIWDLHPNFLEENADLFELSKWQENPIIFKENVKARYDELVKWLDIALFNHGYERQGKTYNAVKPNKDHIVIVCHFGLMSVALSHLLNIPPESLLNFTCARPSAVTTLVTEERVKGRAILRMLEFGSVSHLDMFNEKPSFMARFAEVHGDGDRIL